MSEPELLAAEPERQWSPRVRRRARLGLLGALVAVAIVVAALQGGGQHSGPARRTPQQAAGPGGAAAAEAAAEPAAPVAVDLARAVVDPARHRLRLTFTVFNDRTSRVTLLQVGRASAGLVLDRLRVERFVAGASWRRVQLPVTVHTAEAVHITVAYRLGRCLPPRSAQLRIPAVLADREHGRVTVDLGALVPPSDWPAEFVGVICPVSSR